MTDIIGRGEGVVKEVLTRLYKNTETKIQVPIISLISKENAAEYGEEFSKHKLDILFKFKRSFREIVTLAVAVNFGHKEKAAKKWRQTFAPDLLNNNIIPVTIDDYDCRKKGIFYKNSKGEHNLSWDDFRDVIDQLDKAGVKP